MLANLALLGFLLESCSASAFTQQAQPQVISLNNSAISHKIVGGTIANNGEFPYQGYVIIDNSGLCGCVLIHSRWALTAAHCTVDQTADKLRVTFGTNQMMSNADVVRVATELYNHPSYRSNSNQYDISMMQFENIPLNRLVNVIMLPTSSAELLEINRNFCSITGWGTTSEINSPDTSNLMKATVPLINNIICNDWYSSNRINILDSMICAGFEQGGVDTCQGDSGGPLACPFSNGTLVLIGITSFGNGCARARNPGVYTRVYSYDNWIQTTISENTKNGAKTIGETGQNYKYNLIISVLAIVNYIHCNYVDNIFISHCYVA